VPAIAVLLRGRLPMLEVARPDEHGESVRREVPRDLKTDSFVGPGNQGDGFVLHSNLLFGAMAINDEGSGGCYCAGPRPIDSRSASTCAGI
jgi:hypothetical protein